MRIPGKGSRVSGFGLWDDFLCVFKDLSWRKVWFTGTDSVFNQANGNAAVGTKAPGSIINDKEGRLMFYGSDLSFHDIGRGKISQAVDDTVRNVTPAIVDLIRSTYVAEYDEVRWAIPRGNNVDGVAVTANNKMLSYKMGKWDVYDMAITAFGSWNRVTGSTWDTIPYATWDTIGWDKWDTVESDVGWPVDICSDASGYTYALHGGHADDGVANDRYFVLTTDLANKKALGWKKRLQQIYVYTRNAGSGEFRIRVKRDNEKDWQLLGTVSLEGDTDILVGLLPVDVLASTFLIEIFATSAFHFIGMQFGYIPLGDR
jgi:hypothetical protein